MRTIRRGIILLAGLALVGVVIFAADLRKMDLSNAWSREGWQLPDQVLEALDIRSGQKVADIGCGDGYFTFRLAEKVGTEGIVFAVDVDEETVEDLVKKVAQSNYRNIQVVLGEIDDPVLPDRDIDLVFLCHSYHHIKNREAYFELLRSYLKPGGQLSVIDLKPIPLIRLLLPPGHWISKEAIEQELGRVQFKRTKEWEFLPGQNFQLFAVEPI